MGFVIATNSCSRNEVLFLVDRSKQRRSFWSNQTTDAFLFGSRSAANPQRFFVKTCGRGNHD